MVLQGKPWFPAGQDEGERGETGWGLEEVGSREGKAVASLGGKMDWDRGSKGKRDCSLLCWFVMMVGKTI